MRFAVVALLAAAFLGATVNAAGIPADGKPHVVTVPVADNINVAQLIVAEETRLRQLPIATGIVGAMPDNYKSIVLKSYDVNMTYTDPLVQLRANGFIVGRDNYLTYLVGVFSHPVTPPVYSEVTYQHPGKWILHYTDSVGGVNFNAVTVLNFNSHDLVVSHQDIYPIPLIFFNPKVLGNDTIPSSAIPGLCLASNSTAWQLPGTNCTAV